MLAARASRCRRPLFALLIPLGAAPLAAQETPPPAGTFTEVVSATAVTVTIEVRDAQGRTPPDLVPADLVVLEDGVEAPVLAIERFVTAGGTGAAAASGAAPSAGGAAPWQLVIYVDQPTAGIRTVQLAARELAARAETLATLGSVELIVAAPGPERRLAPSRDPEAIAAALRKLAEKGTGTNDLVQLRREFVAAAESASLDEQRREPGGGVPSGPSGGALNRGQTDRVGDRRLSGGAGAAQRQMLIRNSARREQQLLARQRTLLLDWVALTERPRRPHALLLVSDGFDLDPADFYLSYLDDPSEISALSTDLRELAAGPPLEQLAKTLAGAGWQVVPVSLGQPGAEAATSAESAGRSRFRSFTGASRTGAGGGATGFLLRAPAEPLRLLAAETGGDLALGPEQIGAALAALGERVRLTYQVARDADGALHGLEVRSRRAGLEVRAPRAVAAAPPDALIAARARHLVAVGAVEGTDLPVRLEATAAPDPAQPEAELVTLVYQADLAGIAAGRSRLDAGDLRVTFAVALPDGRLLVSQERPAPRDLGSERRFAARLPLRVPRGTQRIALVIDDLATGAWGGAVASPRR